MKKTFLLIIIVTCFILFVCCSLQENTVKIRVINNSDIDISGFGLNNTYFVDTGPVKIGETSEYFTFEFTWAENENRNFTNLTYTMDNYHWHDAFNNVGPYIDYELVKDGSYTITLIKSGSLYRSTVVSP